MTYHIGFLKQGKRLIVQMADSAEQLSCELWQYMGERITTVEALKTQRTQLLAAANQQFGTDFQRISIRRVPSQDFTGGHVVTLESLIREYRLG